MVRLVQFQNFEARETPILLLADLREIDPTAELVYVGEGKWWLGAVRKTDVREQTGRYIKAFELKRDKPNARNLALAELSIQGFARIDEYVGADPAGVVTDGRGNVCRMVDDFRERDFAWRRDGGEENVRLAAMRMEGLGKKAEAEKIMNDYIRTDGRAHYRKIMRNRVSVGGGNPPVSSRIITI